ncbi:MAG: hypothetical protein KBC95_00205 [Candidatus Peribacteraceae bacterium]|nr:hypothetical protein [Candidatus Peribacteraceae bacterium]
MPRAFRFAAALFLVAIAVAVIVRRPGPAPTPLPPPTVATGASRLTDDDRDLLKDFATMTRAQFQSLTEDRRQSLLLNLVSISTRLPDVRYEEQALSGALLLDGELQGADAFHGAGGQVKVMRLEDGRLAVRLENIAVQKAPLLRLVLSADSEGDPRDQPIALGVLKGNLGSQTYLLPKGTKLDSVLSLSVYFPPFDTVYAFARLR